MSRPDGGIIAKAPSPTANSNKGAWSLRDVTQARVLGNWPVKPSIIPNCSLWLDASDSATLWDATSGGNAVAADGSVARWDDKSGNGLAATQSTSGARPLRKTGIQNGRDVLRFDGSNDCLQVSSIALASHCTVFVVSSSTRTGANYKWYMEHSADVNSNDGMFFGGTNGPAWAIRRTTTDSGSPADNVDWIGNGWVLATLHYNGQGSIYKNASLVSRRAAQNAANSLTSSANTTKAINIASRNQSSLFLNGDIGEIIIYSRALNDYEIAAVSAWLNSRWALW